MTDPIFHLAEPGDWAKSTDEYQPAAFAHEGFIHCSTATQLPKVARDRFMRHNDLVLLTIDPEPLGHTVIYEDLYDSGEEFPHVYGALPANAVLSTGPYLTHLEEGLWLPGTRFDREWMEQILHPEFGEVGRSGQVYTREETLETAAIRLEIELPLGGYRMDLIDEDVALVRYVSQATYEGESLPAERTSVWVNTNEGWRLRFHQGTPLQAG